MNLDQILDPKTIKRYQEYLKSTGVPTATIDRKLSSLKKWRDFVTKNYLPTTQPTQEDILLVGTVPTKTRGSLYQKYSASRIGSYLNLGLLVVFAVAMGIFGYNQIFKEAQVSQAFPQAPNPTTPNRILSFQARLTDSSDTPITTPTDMRFILYDDETASESALLWEELRYIDPDQDGIFSVTLGTEVSIASSVFTENADLWLGVTVETDPEAEPRQRIATVGYALNAETLQGFPPSASASADQIPVLTQEGDLVLAAASPMVYSSSGTFQINGQALSVVTDTGTNGDITIAPDGTGQLLLSGSTTTDNFIRVTNANLTSGHLISGYVGNDTATGDLLNLSSGASEVEKFAVDQDGNTDIAGDLQVNGGSIGISADTDLLSLAANTLTVNGTLNATTALQTGGSTRVDSSGNLTNIGTTQLNSITYTWPDSQSASYVLQTNGSGTLSWVDVEAAASGTIYWDQSDGALYPKNSTVDLLVGSQATTSAKFAVLNVNSGTPVASISSGLSGTSAYLTADGTLATHNRMSLTLGNSSTYDTTGNVLINSNGTGNVGIGTTAPDARLEINHATGDNLRLTYNDTDGSAANYTDFSLSSSGDLTIDSSGGQVYLADTDTLNVGGLTGVAYNALANSGEAPEEAAISSDNDLYIGGDLEVDGTIYGAFAGSITPTGFTEGSVVFAGTDGVLSQDNTNFFWSDSSDRLGINDNTPSYSIDVTGDIRATTDVRGNSLVRGDNVVIGGNDGITACNDYADGICGTSNLWLMTPGNINIVPDTSGTGSGGGNYVAIGNDEATGGYFQINGDYGGNAAFTVKRATASGPDIFAASSSGSVNRFLIQDGGNVGIGDTSPASLLTVGSGDLFQVNSSGIIAAIDGVDHTIDDVSGDLTLTSNSSAVSIADGLTVSGTITANGGLITRDSGNLTISTTTSGNVVLTTAADLVFTGFDCTGNDNSGKLTADASGVISCADDISGGGGGAAGSWQEADGAISPINSTWDVLIGGTATSSAKFAFINVDSGDPTASISGNLALTSPTGADPATTLNILNGGSFDIQTSVGGNGGLTSRLFVANGGNVGIGTNNPSSKLSIAGSTSTISNTSGDITFDSASDVIAFSGDSLTNIDDITATGTILGATAGFGTSSPEALLEVQGAEGTDAIIALDADDGDDVNDTWFIESEAADNDLSFVQGTTERFKIDINGYIHSQRFVDLASSTYFIDPAAVGTSLMIQDDIVSDGAFSITSNASDGDITINAGSGSVIIGATGTGKLDAGTIDPPYTINGQKYATYLPSMTGVKEETTGVVTTNQYVSGVGYRYTIDFTNLKTGSDLWIFSKTTNLKKHLPKMVVLLSPAGSARAWYTMDTINNRLNIFSSRPTTISYRLTAPRFDADLWANTRDGGSAGHVINDSNPWQENQSGAVIGDNFGEVFESIETKVANITTASIQNLNVSGQSLTNFVTNLVNQIVDTRLAQSDEPLISPLIETKNLVVTETVSTKKITAETITTSELVADTIKASTIEGLRDKVADLVASYQEQTATGSASQVDSIKYLVASEFDQLLNTRYELLNTASPSAYLNLDFFEAKAGFFSEYLGVLGRATITDLEVTNTFTTQFISAPNDLLAIQPSGVGAINFLAGLVTFDSSGHVTINGNLTVSGNIVAQKIEARQSQFDDLLALNIVSTGSAKFNQVIAEGFVIAADASAAAQATASASITTNATAGKATLPAGLTEYTIYTPHVTADTLTYVTPIGDPQNQVLYVKSKQICVGTVPTCSPWFKVAINQALPYDLEFNWWTIRLEGEPSI